MRKKGRKIKIKKCKKHTELLEKLPLVSAPGENLRYILHYFQRCSRFLLPQVVPAVVGRDFMTGLVSGLQADLNRFLDFVMAPEH